ncbi:hypothetical protein HDU92_002636 [Lobulomyces angularis]|nr:hypothetical protein HDU92_002636 [Lobulomyces angularis]
MNNEIQRQIDLLQNAITKSNLPYNTVNSHSSHNIPSYVRTANRLVRADIFGKDTSSAISKNLKRNVHPYNKSYPKQCSASRIKPYSYASQGRYSNASFKSVPKCAAPFASKNKGLLIVDGVQYVKSSKGNQLVNAKQKEEYHKKRLINVNGVEFILDPIKKRLVRSTGIPPVSVNLKSTPKKVLLNGKTYHRTKLGNFISDEKMQLDNLKLKTYCKFFNRGCCKKRFCKLIHDPKRIVMCSYFLSENLENPSHNKLACKFSHLPSEFNMPLCRNFQVSLCEKGADCKFLHVKVAKDALICRDFAFNGYCELDFVDNNGNCLNKKCKLFHPKNKLQKKRDLSVEGPSSSTEIGEETTEELEEDVLITPVFDVDPAEIEEEDDDELDSEDDAVNDYLFVVNDSNETNEDDYDVPSLSLH